MSEPHARGGRLRQAAAEALGVAPNASLDEARAAYLRKVQEFPPDRAPQEFERIRDAWAVMQDAKHTARAILDEDDPEAPLASLMEGLPPKRNFVGLKPWMAALKEKG